MNGVCVWHMLYFVTLSLSSSAGWWRWNCRLQLSALPRNVFLNSIAQFHNPSNATVAPPFPFFHCPPPFPWEMFGVKFWLHNSHGMGSFNLLCEMNNHGETFPQSVATSLGNNIPLLTPLYCQDDMFRYCWAERARVQQWHFTISRTHPLSQMFSHSLQTTRIVLFAGLKTHLRRRYRMQEMRWYDYSKWFSIQHVLFEFSACNQINRIVNNAGCWQKPPTIFSRGN